MTPSNNPLDEILVQYIMPAHMHNGVDKRAEAKTAIEAYVEERLKAQREDIRKKLPVKLTREIAALEFGWIDDEAVAYNSVIDQITKILDGEQL